MRLSVANPPMVLGMCAWPTPDRSSQNPLHDVTLHDIAGGLASGIALLRAMAKHPAEVVADEFELTLTALEPQVRRLRALNSTGAELETGGPALDQMIQREASVLGLVMEFEVTGEAALTPAERSLVELTCREAMRNIRRHSGSTRCRVSLNLARCPFELCVRDWGAGMARSSRRDGGHNLLEKLASEIGAILEVGSQPGMGTNVRLIGPCCRHRHAATDDLENSQPRSVVAEESVASRKRVVDRGPIGRIGEQISKT